MLLILSFGANFIEAVEAIFYNTFRFYPYLLCYLGVKATRVFEGGCKAL
jgi:hypothetical protein